ncbi:MAG TPA: aminotransferase class V-fold PLP-dependent enzyme [Polyangiaceae bacterium]|jgi:cysteine desulfurase
MKLPIYMDHHSTTPVDPRVLEAMLPFFSENFGNAASRSHSFGWVAESAVSQARELVAKFLGAREASEVVFTSGATESDNLAIKGVAEYCAGQSRGRHIVTTAIEHRAVLDTCSELERRGFRVSQVPVGSDGIVDPSEIENAITEETALVSVMLANNEIGTIQPIREIGRITSERGVLLHCDAVQGVGRTAFDVAAMRVDLASLSAHKIYGPKGIGALYVRGKLPRVRLVPQIDGGGHERGLRSGTLNVPAIVGFGKACALLQELGPEENPRLGELRDRLYERIFGSLDEVMLNGHRERRVPGNLNLSFRGVQANALMGMLKTVAVSSGSACSSASPEPSYVLRAIGQNEELASASIRFGLGRSNTEEEVDYVADRVVKAVRELRSF